MGEDLLEHFLALMPPRLLSTVLSIGNSLDLLIENLSVQPPKSVPSWALKSQLWQDSERCGMLVMRVDRDGTMLSGMDVNNVWAERIAGLHREEFISRGCAGEQRCSTSELRVLCKVFDQLSYWWKLWIHTRKESGDPPPPGSPQTSYLRYGRNWGRADRGPGVLVRVRSAVHIDPADPNWCYFQHVSVEVTEEEYEAVRAQKPEACEGYMIPLVGSKSAAELIDPQLADEESLAFLNASAEGHAVLDRLSDKLLHDFAFVFQALAEVR